MRNVSRGFAAVVCGLLCAGLAQAQQRLEPPDPALPAAGNPLIREGDLHYARRQDMRVGAVAGKSEIAAAVRAFSTATEAADSPEARWKLARALVFQGLYTELDASARQSVFEKARRAAEDAIGILERRVKRGGHQGFEALSTAEIALAVRKGPDAAPIFYWAAVAWGRWALARGKEEATKLGAAEKIRDYASILVTLDPIFEDGGGYRLLGRLHDEASQMEIEPEWASHEEAVRNLRLAVKTDAANFANRLFLAEALAPGAPAERAEAVRIAQGLVAESPSPARLVEELRLQEEAAGDLRAWK
ncbi:MAG: hypothetical protein ACRD1B_00880 [Thermoanaerobaculia bacterium]